MNNLLPIYYETTGNPIDPCIILIMGIGGQLIHWPVEFIQALVNNNFYVVTFDNRDAGLSRYYDELGTPNIMAAINAKQQGKAVSIPYTLTDMADDVLLLMNKLSIKQAHIAGISMGGMISQIIALTYPERVLSLTCIASSSGDPNLPPAKPEVLDFFFNLQKPIQNLEDYVDNKLQLHKIYNHPEHVDAEKSRELFIKTYQRAHNPAGFTRQLLAIMAAEPRTEKLKNLCVPSLIIHGDYDPVFQLPHGKQLAECLPNSHLEIIEKMGHGLPECLAERIANLICCNAQ